MQKLLLGTVQFGINYGINNPKGQISKADVFDILDLAYENEIDTLDTAPIYGESEGIIGEYQTKRKRFNIISKIPASVRNIKDTFNNSLKKLNIDKLYGYIFHDYPTFYNNQKLYDELKTLKDSGKIEKIGFSLYYPEELEYLLENKVEFDLLQIPYNIFDQRFSTYFEVLKKNNVEIHVRSIFLQGLFFKDIDSLSNYFLSIKDKLQYLKDISSKNNIPLNALCLLFGFRNNFIDKIVIGVDNINHLDEDIRVYRYIDKFNKIFSSLVSLKIDDKKIIIPSLWAKKES